MHKKHFVNLFVKVEKYFGFSYRYHHSSLSNSSLNKLFTDGLFGFLFLFFLGFIAESKTESSSGS